jgi:putative acetyltransferase
MLNLIRTNSGNLDFQELVRQLDIELKMRDGDEHAFFAQYNKSDTIKYVVLAYEENIAVGCGAIKEYKADTMEVKRMFVPLEKRGQGIAAKVLIELEQWSKELNYKKCILETGLRQPEAIRLYEKSGYTRIPNYGQYKEVLSSVCFEKVL